MALLLWAYEEEEELHGRSHWGQSHQPHCDQEVEKEASVLKDLPQ